LQLPDPIRLAVLLVLGLSCSGGGPTSGAPAPTESTASSAPRLAKLVVITAPQTLLVGETASATVNGFDQTDRPFSLGATVWTSSSPAVATISPQGIVTAVAPGTATIGAASAGVSGEFQVAVISRAAPAAIVNVTPASVSIGVGDTAQLTATLFTASGIAEAGRPVSWISSNPAVVTVSDAGLVRAIDVGTVVISAIVGDIHGTAPITVSGVADSGIQVAVISPGLEQTVTDTLRASATVASARPLRRVLVTVGSRQVPLGTMKVGPVGKQVDGWGADVDISREPAGPGVVTFSAFDIDGHFWTATAPFDHTPPRGGSGVPPATGHKLVAPPSAPRTRVSSRRAPNPANPVTAAPRRPSK
jgi:hypothetical protein